MGRNRKEAAETGVRSSIQNCGQQTVKSEEMEGGRVLSSGLTASLSHHLKPKTDREKSSFQRNTHEMK